MKILNIDTHFLLLISTFLTSAACGESLAADRTKNDIDRSLSPFTLLKSHCDALYDLAYELVDYDLSTGKVYGEKSLEIALKLGDSTRILKAARITSFAYRKLGLTDSALNLMLKYVDVAQRSHNTEQLTYYLNGIALSYLDKSLYDQALRYFFESLQVREEHGSQIEVSMALNNLGLLYFKLQDYDMAIVYYSKAMGIAKKIASQEVLNDVGFNIALCYTYKGDYEAASHYLNDSFLLCGSNCPSLSIANAKFTQ